MKLKKIMIVFASILILLLQESYANPLGRVIAVAGGQILLEFVGGFANKLGETTAEALIRKYPPPPPKEQKWGVQKRGFKAIFFAQFLDPSRKNG